MYITSKLRIYWLCRPCLHFYNHTINCIALFSQQQPTAVQSSCRKDESSIFKKDTNYVHWMYEVHWPSVPVSGGGGAELTETRRPVSTLQSPLPWTPLWNLSVAAASSEQHHAANTSVSMYKL